MKEEWKPIVKRLVAEGVDRNVVLKILRDEKKHSDFSASGSERWLNCPGSVQMVRKLPKSPNTYWSVDGSVGHYYLEIWIKRYIESGKLISSMPKSLGPAKNIRRAVTAAMNEILLNFDRNTEELHTETRMSLEYILDGMFGTTDLWKYDTWFKKLSVWDYKQGKQPVETHWVENGVVHYNTQLMFYLLAAAKKIGFKNISECEIGVIQPNAPIAGKIFRTTSFDVSVLKQYETFFMKGVKRALAKEAKFHEGSWCHWCPAKENGCPLKEQIEQEKIASYF